MSTQWDKRLDAIEKRMDRIEDAVGISGPLGDVIADARKAWDPSIQPGKPKKKKKR